MEMKRNISSSKGAGSTVAQLAYTLKLATRRPVLLFWTLAFPILMSLLFALVLGNTDEHYRLQPASVAVVEDAAYRTDTASMLRKMLETAAEPGESHVLELTKVDGTAQADALLTEGKADAVITVDDDGMPTLRVGPSASGSVSVTAVRTLLDRYRSVAVSMETLAAEAPQALATPEAQAHAVTAFISDTVRTAALDILHTAPVGNVRFFYALLAYATVQPTIIVLAAIQDLRASMSPAGFRRQVGAMPQTKLLFTAIASSYLATFACCLIAWAFQRFVLGIPFGDRDGLAVLAVAVCAAVGVSLGAFIAAIPRLTPQAKESLSLAVTLVASLGAGLYGDPAMAFSDWLSAHLPVLQLANPAAQATQAFYSLLYYTDLQPFWQAIGVLAVIATICLTGATLFMRRQRYEAL